MTIKKCNYHKQIVDGYVLNKGVDFYIHAPDGKILVVDFEKISNTHHVIAPVTGDYKFCFKTADDTDRRVVFFEMVAEDVTKFPNEPSSDEFKEVNEILSKVGAHLVKVRYLQELIKSGEARNRHTAEAVRSRLELQSVCEVVLNVILVVLQVIFVRTVVDTGDVLRGDLRNSKVFS